MATLVPGAGTMLGDLRFEGGFELEGTVGGFGGLSGLEAIDESTLLAVTDDGGLVEIALGRTADGAPTAACAYRSLADADGARLRNKRFADAEGLALLAPGRIAASFERTHRIAFFALGDDIREDGEAIDFSGARALDSNYGVEALTLLPSGALLAGAESPTLLASPHPVWRLAPTGDPAHPFAAPGAPAFEIVTESGFGLSSFDVTPRGGLLVLERFYTEALGTRIRIGWLAPGVAEDATGRVRVRLLARLDRGDGVGIDNFEAIAALDAGDGRTTIWIVSDDNFNESQRTLLYRFSFDEAALLDAEG